MEEISKEIIVSVQMHELQNQFYISRNLLLPGLHRFFHITICGCFYDSSPWESSAIGLRFCLFTGASSCLTRGHQWAKRGAVKERKEGSHLTKSSGILCLKFPKELCTFPISFCLLPTHHVPNHTHLISTPPIPLKQVKSAVISSYGGSGLTRAKCRR